MIPRQILRLWTDDEGNAMLMDDYELLYTIDELYPLCHLRGKLGCRIMELNGCLFTCVTACISINEVTSSDMSVRLAPGIKCLKYRRHRAFFQHVLYFLSLIAFGTCWPARGTTGLMIIIVALTRGRKRMMRWFV